MLKATLLGCAGSRPTASRPLTALAVQIDSKVILIDCGEGTQVSLLKTGVNCYEVAVICLTHVHGDHTLGLPGLLSSMDQLVKVDSQDKDKKDVFVIAPISCKSFIASVRDMVGLSKLDLHCVWLSEETESFEFEGFYINAYKVKHSVECYGYNVIEKAAPRFSKEKAEMCGLARNSWGFLQKGYTVVCDRELYTVNDITDGKVSPVKVAYVTDTLPCPGIQKCIEGADLAILEGMYASAAEYPKQIAAKHLTFEDAARAAKEAGVKNVWLAHFSQTLGRPEEKLDKARSIFKRIRCGYLGLSAEFTALKDKVG